MKLYKQAPAGVLKSAVARLAPKTSPTMSDIRSFKHSP